MRYTRLATVLAGVLAAISLFVIGIQLRHAVRSTEQDAEHKAYEILAGYARELEEMRKNILELDEAVSSLAALPLPIRMRETREIQELHVIYQRLAAAYNNHMASWEYRFSDKARLPEGARYGPLPRAFDPMILLKTAPKA